MAEQIVLVVDVRTVVARGEPASTSHENLSTFRAARQQATTFIDRIFILL